MRTAITATAMLTCLRPLPAPLVPLLPTPRPARPLCLALRSLTVWAGAPGKLLEVNQRLGQEGQGGARLLFDHPCCEGWVAIVFPSDAQVRPWIV